MNKEVELLTLDTDINVNKTKVQCSINTESEVKIEIAKDGEKRPTYKVYIKEIEVLQILNKGIK